MPACLLDARLACRTTWLQYKPETFEALAHTQTVDKLVKFFGYPEQLYDLTFDHTYMCRGLIIDKRRGNMLKVGSSRRQHPPGTAGAHSGRSGCRARRRVAHGASWGRSARASMPRRVQSVFSLE